MSSTATDLARTYHFADFTRAQYRELLLLAQSQYTFASFDAEPFARTIYWRHDVDYSVHAARALARIEAEHGVRATYCFRIRSEMYNLFEASVLSCAKNILALGHDLGLHVEPEAHGVTTEDALDGIVEWESAILERVLEHPVRVVSFHQPTAFLLSCQRARYGGRVNTYATQFQTRVGYVADSNGYWRHRRLRDVLTEASDEHLQVLTHPEWWTDAPMSPAARIERCITGRADATRAYYRDDMQRFGRTNVGA